MSVHFPAGFDFTSPDLWSERRPEAEFAELRKSAPVWWQDIPPGTTGFDDGGFWVVSKLEDIKAISRNPKQYSNWENGAIVRFGPEIEREQIDVQRMLLLNMDPPQHTKTRRIISRGFTPKAVQSLHDALAERAEQIVHEARKSGGGDFVEQVASELPLQAIAELLGVPQEDRKKLFDWSNSMMAYDDPEFEGNYMTAMTEFMGYSWNLAEERRGCPMDDIVTSLIQADIDGEALGSDEFAFFVLLLAVAGNETTRNAISHGMKAFVDFPEQWEIYKEQRPRTAPDEIVRWATPVSVFQRTALEDVQLGEQTIKKGQRVALFYASANFDEDAFEDPFTFNILRDPNPHVGFGGSGTHHCVGANLARLEMDLMFKAIADVMPNLRQIEEPRRLRSGWLNGIKHWKVAYE
ncbi:Cytochrome P450 monooxygenase OS=Tsukamurella paurometabola (strain ATCC 8368 / DSM / CCUG 35730/ CIP 100753 / JCM 10117 / KCTC 9821 / NBRC 16120 / NCIMB 702349 / NCTC 13040) OX=521096 GN=Tpau_3821 PE=3 SV=1 [Tsukamurella paurometabola]|uniref:Cytochrome P450 monooxygenase n=1 Tax=Tsukamurella paurometabola (strain ATCC 8368 / DSM 20162 / CCUG 35730 / CIP 100753 / JCM 10117 / KCTC 9821 / NBRC 16120 / NCIMB 702349 / NCTC 13040) TaxID=521096 RepID=D5UYU3_TSUPD|nr:cytochrome P450 [Tsukamurella paurometabola]ADG80396.1 cytochrome P450 monooxygenase [Tsukamurella paurometabola DSM 20162]SUP39475.1 Steroid C27-monooxygenase [Tsukamurella paurometabola]